MRVKMTDNSEAVLRQLEANKKKALAAMGQTCVEIVQNQMQHGYRKPIRKTGTLIRDVQMAVENSGPDGVDVGNTVKYSIYVHEGTSKMKGRPYMKDSLLTTTASGKIESAAIPPLKEGFE